MTNTQLTLLKYPEDRARLTLLGPERFQMWYAAQNARQMIYLGNNAKFKRFVWWAYTWKVSALRFWFKIKQTVTVKTTALLSGNTAL